MTGSDWALGIAGAAGTDGFSCNYVSPTPVAIASAYTGPIYATCGNGCDVYNASWPVTVTDRNGTVFTFPQTSSTCDATNVNCSSLPSEIEDRNGNYVTITDSGNGVVSAVDTAGRTVFASNGFGASGQTIVLPSGTYTLEWEAAPANYTPPTAQVGAGAPDCYPPGANQEQPTVISAINLPDGQSFQFYYDST